MWYQSAHAVKPALEIGSEGISNPASYYLHLSMAYAHQV